MLKKEMCSAPYLKLAYGLSDPIIRGVFIFKYFGVFFKCARGATWPSEDSIKICRYSKGFLRVALGHLDIWYVRT